jgi:hypothetical protein
VVKGDLAEEIETLKKESGDPLRSIAASLWLQA